MTPAAVRPAVGFTDGPGQPWPDKKAAQSQGKSTSGFAAAISLIMKHRARPTPDRSRLRATYPYLLTSMRLVALKLPTEGLG